MERGYWTRVGLVTFVVLAALWFLIPSYYSLVVLPPEQRNDMEALQRALPSWAPSAERRLNLGLDLQGGIHMVMRVDTETALEKRAERRGLQIANYLRREGHEVALETRPEALEVLLTPEGSTTLEAIEQEALEFFTDFEVVSRAGGTLTLGLNESVGDRFKTESVDQAMLVIRRRVDRWGVAEVDVRRLGTDSIQVSLPGQQDPEQAKQLIGTTAQLEFRLVDDRTSFLRDIFESRPPDPASAILLDTQSAGFAQLIGPDREALLAYIGEDVPEDREVLLECIPSTRSDVICESYRAYVLHREAPITGDSVVGADAALSNTNQPEVNISFDAQGARDFGTLTAENVDRYMAIVLDDQIQSAPRINEPIPGGTARITMGARGSRTIQEHLQEAQTLALTLKAGALPAPVTTGEVRQVGAALGEELIEKGSFAAVLGLLLVLAFLPLYYKLSGVVTDVALVVNGILLLAGLALFNATLTLPGIAGFVLTLGMAVDANVLINERIREELAKGRTARAAVDVGYDRVFWTIFDANVTTLIAGTILFFTGSGPVKGFATALIIGILASMFTAIVLTRLIVTGLVHGRKAETISI